MKSALALLLLLAFFVVTAELIAGAGLPPPVRILESSAGPERFRVRPYLDIPFEGYSSRTKPVRLLTDGNGYRVSPHDIELGRPFEAYIFGDEFVFGEGLEARETFPARFEAKYLEVYREQLKVRNASVPGYNLRLSVERLIGVLKSHPGDFDWFLVISENDLQPVPGTLARAPWSVPPGSRIFLRLARLLDRFQPASSLETDGTAQELARRLKEAADGRPKRLSCVIMVATESELHVQIADRLATAGRCTRHDAGKQLNTDPGRSFLPGTRILTAEGAAELALRSIVPLSASFSSKAVENFSPAGNPPSKKEP